MESVYKIEAKDKAGHWVTFPHIEKPTLVWEMLQNMYLSMTELIVRDTLDGTIHVHVKDGELIYPVESSDISKEARRKLIDVLKARIN